MLTKEKYRINKREDINLTQTERTTDRIGKEAKNSQAKITTYKICTASAINTRSPISKERPGSNHFALS